MTRDEIAARLANGYADAPDAIEQIRDLAEDAKWLLERAEALATALEALVPWVKEAPVAYVQYGKPMVVQAEAALAAYRGTR